MLKMMLTCCLQLKTLENEVSVWQGKYNTVARERAQIEEQLSMLRTRTAGQSSLRRSPSHLESEVQ